MFLQYENSSSNVLIGIFYRMSPIFYKACNTDLISSKVTPSVGQ